MNAIFLILLVNLSLVSCTVNQPNHDQLCNEIEFLKYIKTTHRIDGNKFSEFVTDVHNNSYIASFEMGAEGIDRPLLIKVNCNGEIVWEHEELNKLEGRLTGIAKLTEKSFWVCGFFTDRTFKHAGTVNQGIPNKPFAFLIDTSGVILSKIEGSFGGIFLHCTVNSKTEELFVFGMAGKELSLDLIKAPVKSGSVNFIAKYNKSGTCEWVTSLDHANVSCMVVDKISGEVVVGGSFNSSLNLGQNSFKTTGNFDEDAFYAVINQDGTLKNSNQLGKPLVYRYGYRTNEKVNVMSYENGKILFGALIGENALNVYSYHNHKLTLTDSNIISGFSDGQPIEGIFENDVFFLSGSFNDSLYVNGQLYLVQEGKVPFICKFRETNNGYKLEWLRTGLISKNNATSFRSMKSTKDFLFLSGHYRENFNFDTMKLDRQPNNSMFFLKLKK